jgi:alpha-glucosidase
MNSTHGPHNIPLRHLPKIVAFLAFLNSTALAGNSHVVTSPDAQTRVEITENAGQLSYSVQWQDKKILLPSRLDLFDGGNLEITRAEKTESDKVWKPVWGQFSQVRDQFRGLVLHLNHGEGAEVLLECRVFNDGFGLRFRSEGKPLAAVDKVNFRSEYR